MNIKAKMKCDDVQQLHTGGSVETDKVFTERVKLSAVYSEDKASENYSFSNATPSASVEMTISNPDAIGAFEQGKEYYVEFSPAA